MNKVTVGWTVQELRGAYTSINFPEYQREPNIWSRAAKQRLIDSVLRHFDIASLYLYQNEDGSLDCIDGRQRIGAIMSFLGENPEDEDNAFSVRNSNEIFEEQEVPFRGLDGVSYGDIRTRAGEGDATAQQFLARLDGYRLTIVQLSGATRPEEFNLQFTRLNVGTIINSGEKLHAMVGDMRDVCFNELGQHPFLERVGIPTRRYAKEQVAAQILAQVFAFNETGQFTRTRHFDLQRFFKEQAALDAAKRAWVATARDTLDRLAGAFPDPGVLRNRAITVSVALQAWRRQPAAGDEIHEYAGFVEEFLCRLKWQVGKGLDVDPEYRYLIDFQRHVTQASVEKPAVEARADRLNVEYDTWRANQVLSGDIEYQGRTGGDPADDCRPN